MSNLCLILGAGASYDCIISDVVQTPRPDLKPPLTKDIFSPLYDGILKKYPKASALAAELRLKLKQDHPLSLEQLLRREQEKATPSRKKQIRQIPLYLRELFGLISYEYVDPAQTCYTMLINKICDENFNQVLVINLNYDILFETALKTVLDIEFKTVDDYFNKDKKWKVLKPHGSINWIRKLYHSGSIYGGSSPNLDLIDSLDELVCDGEIKIAGTGEHFFEGKCAYPSMVIPVDGKYGFCCPDYQVNKAKELLRHCDSFLVIGFSFKDKDVTDILKECTKKVQNHKWAHLVNKIENNQQVQYQDIANQCLGNSQLCNQGFSGYINDRSCTNFIEGIFK